MYCIPTSHAHEERKYLEVETQLFSIQLLDNWHVKHEDAAMICTVGDLLVQLYLLLRSKARSVVDPHSGTSFRTGDIPGLQQC